MKYQFIELYEVDGVPHGQFTNADYFNTLRKEYHRCFKLPGKTVTHFFVVSDNELRSEDALDFIAKFETGRVVFRNIDLSSVSSVRTGKNAKRRNTK